MYLSSSFQEESASLPRKSLVKDPKQDPDPESEPKLS